MKNYSNRLLINKFKAPYVKLPSKRYCFKNVTKLHLDILITCKTINYTL